MRLNIDQALDRLSRYSLELGQTEALGQPFPTANYAPLAEALAVLRDAPDFPQEQYDTYREVLEGDPTLNAYLIGHGFPMGQIQRRFAVASPTSAVVPPADLAKSLVKVLGQHLEEGTFKVDFGNLEYWEFRRLLEDIEAKDVPGILAAVRYRVAVQCAMYTIPHEKSSTFFRGLSGRYWDDFKGAEEALNQWIHENAGNSIGLLDRQLKELFDQFWPTADPLEELAFYLELYSFEEEEELRESLIAFRDSVRAFENSLTGSPLSKAFQGTLENLGRPFINKLDLYDYQDYDKDSPQVIGAALNFSLMEAEEMKLYETVLRLQGKEDREFLDTLEAWIDFFSYERTYPLKSFKTSVRRVWPSLTLAQEAALVLVYLQHPSDRAQDICEFLEAVEQKKQKMMKFIEGEVATPSGKKETDLNSPSGVSLEIWQELKKLALSGDEKALDAYFRKVEKDTLWAVYAAIYDDLQLHLSFTKALIADHLKYTFGENILDVGAGTGIMSMKYLRTGLSVVAVEPNSFMVARLEAKVSNIGNLLPLEILKVSFEEADLDSRGGFDTVNLRNVLYLANDPADMLRKAAEQTRIGGRVLVSGPLRDAVGTYGDLYRKAEEEIEKQGRQEELGWKNALAFSISRFLLDGESKNFNVDEIVRLLMGLGFGRIRYATNEHFGGRFYFVVAERTPGSEARKILSAASAPVERIGGSGRHGNHIHQGPSRAHHPSYRLHHGGPSAKNMHGTLFAGGMAFAGASSMPEVMMEMGI